jgi:hypothetical protein
MLLNTSCWSHGKIVRRSITSTLIPLSSRLRGVFADHYHIAPCHQRQVTALARAGAGGGDFVGVMTVVHSAGCPSLLVLPLRLPAFWVRRIRVEARTRNTLQMASDVSTVEIPIVALELCPRPAKRPGFSGPPLSGLS